MDLWSRHPLTFATFLLPGLSVLIVLFAIPLSLVWLLGFGERQGPVEIELTWTLANYIKALDPLYLQLFLKSLIVAIIATAITLIVGFPIALTISFASTRAKALLLLLIILPFWTNMLIRTYAMIAVLRTKGYANFGLEYLWESGRFLAAFAGMEGLFGERFQPLELLYNNSAVVVGIVYIYLPFMILPLYASLEKLDHRLLEASLDLGASQIQTFWKVVVPLARPGIVSGIILVSIPALGTFLISDLLGGPDSQLIGNVIERQFKAANNWPLGSALSFLLLYITFIALVAHAYFGSKND